MLAVARDQPDRLDQRPDRLGRLCAQIVLVQRLGEVCHLLAVDIGEAGMEARQLTT